MSRINKGEVNMNETFETNEIYKTKDFYLACYLQAKNIQLVKTERRGNIVIFCFKNRDGNNKKINDYITDFYSDIGMVSANKFVKVIKDFKTLIYNLRDRGI